MITKITGEQPFQVLTNNFSISPSNEGYTLQISADGKEYSNLFSVGAGVTRLVTGVAANSYYRLLGNQSEVKVNWMKTCVTEGGGGAAGNELTPVADFPLDAEAGTVVAYSGSSSAAGIYQFDGTDWVAAGGSVDLSAYWTSAQTKDYVDSADTAILAEVGELSGVVQEQQIVFSSGYNELHTQVMELSGRTVDLSGYYTSGETDAAISEATAGKADAASVSANTNTSRWPAWNSQGIITGTVGNIGYEASLTINGTQKWLWGNGSSGSFGKIYAPTNAGTAGQILTPSGNTPVWVTPATINGSAITAGGNIEIQGGGDMSDYWTSAQTKAYVDSADTALQDQLDTMDEVVSAALVDLNDTKVASTDIKHMVKITQADYEDLPVKDPYTFYIIISNS